MRLSNLMVLFLLLNACTKKADQEMTDRDSSQVTVSAIEADLKALEEDFLPESLSESGAMSESNVASNKLSMKTDGDVCEGIDFMECQSLLVRTYLLYGKAAVGLTHQIVKQVAKDLYGAPNNSSGQLHLEGQDVVLHFNKKTLLDFDFLIAQADAPVIYVSAHPPIYKIQFNILEMEKNQPESRGGKMEIRVNFNDRRHWESQITFNELLCDVEKPEDPQAIRIEVRREGEIWKGQTSLYSPRSLTSGEERSCDTVATDATSLVVYTDFVANRLAAKASLYAMNRSKSTVVDLENFGLNNLCETNSSACQTLATVLGTSTASVDNYLNSFSNPFCLRRGTLQVDWNSSCMDHPLVSQADYLPLTNWLAPLDFYQLQLVMPHEL